MVMITGTGTVVSGRYTSAFSTSPSSMGISTFRSMIMPSGTFKRLCSVVRFAMAAPPIVGRTRISSRPRILVEHGRLRAAVDTPRGRHIPTAIAQVIVNLIDRGLGVQDAIAAPRLHAEGPVLRQNSVR